MAINNGSTGWNGARGRGRNSPRVRRLRYKATARRTGADTGARASAAYVAARYGVRGTVKR